MKEILTTSRESSMIGTSRKKLLKKFENMVVLLKILFSEFSGMFQK